MYNIHEYEYTFAVACGLLPTTAPACVDDAVSGDIDGIETGDGDGLVRLTEFRVENQSSSTLPVAITLALVLALPSWAHAGPPPEQIEPATEAPIVVVDEGQPVDADPQPVVPPTPQLQAVPAPPPPMAATPHYSQSPAYDLSPRAKPNDGLGLTIAGFCTFGVSYAVGVLSTMHPVGAIPVAGPMIGGAWSINESEYVLFPGLASLWGVGLILNGVAQGVGLGLGITGAVKLGTARRQARLSATGGGLRLQF